MRVRQGTKIGVCATVFVVFTVGCFGWFSSPSVERTRYHLIGAEGSSSEVAAWEAVQGRLQTRLAARGFDDGVVTLVANEIIVDIERREGRAAPNRLFEIGKITVHRVDELQSRGSDRVMRQALDSAKMDRTLPPETLWVALREQNLLAEDKLAFYSETEDGRDEMVVIQEVAFLHQNLFEGAEQMGEGANCSVAVRWTERMIGILTDPRQRRQKDRVAVMLDGNLVKLVSPNSLLNAQNRLVLDVPDEEQQEGGRRIWERRDAPERWCRDLTAVLASEPLPLTLELKEMKVIPPEE